METRIDEIADGIYRLSTWVAEIAPPAGLTFNQYIIDADEPLLFHTGGRALFPLVSEAAAKVVDLDELRWISFGHVESDESGSMNQWLQAAPQSQITFGELGCLVQLNDLADRPPRPLAEGEVLDLGGKRVRQISTPHVPHAWEAQVLYEETTGTLLCGDLFTHLGNGPAVTGGDIVGPAMEAEAIFRGSSLAPDTALTIGRLADLRPATLAVMHGSCYAGDGGAVLEQLAQQYDERYLASTVVG